MFDIIATFSGWGIKFGQSIIFFKRDTESSIEAKKKMAKDKISEIEKIGIENFLPKQEEQEPEIKQDEINAEILLNQANIQAKQTEQDEVLAELLLNTVSN